jgi:D-alanyl-D-alanine carboxypeptidase (penicillin-binding protein 5/6)
VRTGLRFVVALACGLLASAAHAATPAAADNGLFPGGASAFVVQIDGDTAWSRAADRPLPPASLTKIMTALLFIESGQPLDGVATVSASAARATGTRLGLKAGERMKAGGLLAATLLLSANDACLALAEHVSGDKARFTQRMNQRASELGLAHTHFTNPCGHDEPGHRSTARDLAVLAAATMAKPLFAELVATVDLPITTLDGRRFQLENKNELIGRYPGAVGVKSGYTPGAGKCLVAMARRDGATVLLVVLNAPNRWWDSAAALDKAFMQAKARR